MSSERHEFEYSRLHSLTFTQLFRLLVAMARWHSTLRLEALIVELATDCCRKRLSQLAYAALFLSDHGIRRLERLSDLGTQKRPQRLRH
jgi:hypothetical protein